MEHMTNISDVKKTIKESVTIYLSKDAEGNYLVPQNKQRPLFLLGPAGIGKTEIVEQAAEECGIGFVSYSLTHHTRQSAVGLPAIVSEECCGSSYESTRYTMPEIIDAVYRCIAQGQKEGILFVDEVNCVSETMLAVMLQFLQNKSFGTHKIPRGWVIVSAGNPVEYNRSARRFDAVTRDRIRVISVEPDAETWIRYAENRGMHPIVISFIRNNHESIYVFHKERKDLSIVTPRGWEDLSNTLTGYEKFGYKVDVSLITQFIQDEETAGTFYSYYELYKVLLRNGEIDRLLENGDFRPAAELLKRLDFQSRWAVICIILKRLGDDGLVLSEQFRKFRSGEEGKADITRMNSQLDQWHLRLENCLKCIEEGSGKGAEMEYFLSSICCNRNTGYLLALRENQTYDRLYREVNGTGISRRELKNEISRQIKKGE